MNVIITGGRGFRDSFAVDRALSAFHYGQPISLLIHGDAKGAVTLGKNWAIQRGILVATVSAPWDFYGKSAGGLRNRAMLRLAPEYLIAFPGGVGTNDMKTAALEAGLKIWEPYA